MAVAIAARRRARRRRSRAGGSRRRSSPRRRGSSSRRSAVGAPFGGFPWADLGVALHDLPPARALASFGGGPARELRGRSRSTGFAPRPRVRLRRAPSRRAVALAASGVVAMLVVTRARRRRRGTSPTDDRARSASRCCRVTTRSCRWPSRQMQLLTDKHLALAEQLQGHYDLIVFPEAALDTDPDQDPERAREARRPSPRNTAPAVLVNARTPAGNGENYNSNLMYTPDGTLQGMYSKQHLVPFGEYVPWRGALGFIGELRQIPYDFRAGDRTRVPVPAATGRQRDLLRVGVRPARARLRARRRGDRRGEHQQPLVPALGQLRAAPGDRPDARRRDRPAGAAGVGLGHQRGDRSRRRACTTRPACSRRRS